MPNTRDATTSPFKRILLAGRTGSGKSTQIWSLPGKKFAYFFDPNALVALERDGYRPDVDYEPFYPEALEVDFTLKGFNRDSIDDKPNSKREPTLYNRWGDHLNEMVEKGRLIGIYDWLIIDSGTFLSKSVMDRQLYINKRFGGTEEIADYKVVGSKLAEVFGPITTAPINVLLTAHLQVYQDEKTKKLATELYLPGRARVILPLQFSDVFQTLTEEDKDGNSRYLIRTKPDPKGLQDIRTSMPDLETFEDVTIERFDDRSVEYGIGGLLSGKRRRKK